MVHALAIAVIMRLQPRARDATPQVIALELIAPTTTPPPTVAPTTETATPPPAVRSPRPRAAIVSRSPSVSPASPQSSLSPGPRPSLDPSPPSPAPPPPDSTGSLLSPRRTGIDLTWRGTPSSSPPGDTASPTVGTVGPRPEWRPKGTASDPILGKLDELPDDPYPLIKKKDGWVYKGAGFAAKIHKDGSVTFDDKVIGFDKGIIAFDLTDAIMRAKKQDPYRREKEKFLAHTRAMREKLLDQARAFRDGVIAPTGQR